ncbi:MAG: PEP-CTERM sorting domain-containing protein [Isosphaeraceae bacterium]|nr:PEP-CTERM sorting domain-containing protein [Isosphaeraceae bacterium]
MSKQLRRATTALGFAALIVLGWMPRSGEAGIVVTRGTSTTPAGLTPVRDAFRNIIGGGNVPGANGSFGGVRREINWDGVPDSFSQPNLLPGNFFNVNSPRGAVFTTPGDGFMVSADSSNPTATPPSFGFPADFVPFSPQRLFAPVGSNVFDTTFFVAGTTTVAGVTAFGAIFNDVEVSQMTKMEIFDLDGNSIGSEFVDINVSGGLSFLGFHTTAGELIGRVRFTLGANILLANGEFANGQEAVVLDDFIYSEARAVPEPASIAAAVVGLGFGLVAIRRRRSA